MTMFYLIIPLKATRGQYICTYNLYHLSFIQRSKFFKIWKLPWNTVSLKSWTSTYQYFSLDSWVQFFIYIMNRSKKHKENIHLFQEQNIEKLTQFFTRWCQISWLCPFKSLSFIIKRRQSISVGFRMEAKWLTL